MNFQSWTTMIASTTADTSALISFFQPLLNLITTPIFVIGGVVLIVSMLLLLVHGRQAH